MNLPRAIRYKRENVLLIGLIPLPASAHTLVYVKYSISLCPFPDDSPLVDINVNLLLANGRSLELVSMTVQYSMYFH